MTTNALPSTPGAQDALARIGAEMRRVSLRLGRVEEALGPILDELGSHRLEALADLQEIDMARQETEALAQVMARLAAAAPPQFDLDLADAARALPLAALTLRLTHGERDEGEDADDPLFD